MADVQEILKKKFGGAAPARTGTWEISGGIPHGSAFA